jgi:ribonuclease D
MNPNSPITLPPGIEASISREAIACLPVSRYAGEICLVDSADDLDRARADLDQESVVGFDTETRPAFKKGESHLPCLAQIATGRAVYLFRLQDGAVLGALAHLLSDARVRKVGIGLSDDLRTLKHVFAFEAQQMLDLGGVARRHGLEQTGLRNLAGIFLGVRIPKGAKTSNWAARQLSPAQITYAATDAWICRELYLKFIALGLIASAQA